MSCCRIIQNFIFFNLKDKDILKKGHLSIIHKGVRTTVTVLTTKLVIAKSPEVKDFMEALQAGIDFNVNT